ncbi:MAG: photosystem II stability/assembly factor-like protein [Gammaproteobacteria bacterium]|nr:photosystem II stability/assembly factor-like protein [Gammaproteobacteria bacterium]
MNKLIRSCRRYASLAAVLSCSAMLAMPALAEEAPAAAAPEAAAQEQPAADQTVEVVRTGIPHDALFALDMKGPWGLAVGNFGLMLETKDAGAKWETLPAKTSLGLLGAKRAGDHQVVVGQQGLVMTRNGDGEWTEVKSGFDKRLLNVDMNEAGLAVTVGEFGFVGRSKDFGATWEPVTINWSDFNNEGYEPHLYGVIVTAEGAIMVAGEFGLILRSDDGGDTWHVVNKGEESIFYMALARDGSNSGYAVGQEGLILKTTDGGATWARIKADTNANLLGVWSGNGEVVIVGIRQMLRSSDDGATFSTSTDVGIVRTWFQGIAAGVSETKAGEKGFLRQQNVFVAGYRGTIARVVK